MMAFSLGIHFHMRPAVAVTSPVDFWDISEFCACESPKALKGGGMGSVLTHRVKVTSRSKEMKPAAAIVYAILYR